MASKVAKSEELDNCMTHSIFSYCLLSFQPGDIAEQLRYLLLKFVAANVLANWFPLLSNLSITRCINHQPSTNHRVSQEDHPYPLSARLSRPQKDLLFILQLSIVALCLVSGGTVLLS